MAQPMSLTMPAAVVLAGGLGSRLRSVVGDRPKVLAPVAGRPFLEYLLRQLVEAGVRDAVLCTGFGADAVAEVMGDGTRFGLRLRYSREDRPLGTGGALRQAVPLLGPGPALILNGDSFVPLPLASLGALHARRAARATLLLARVPDCGRFGAVSVDCEGRIVRFEEKTRPGPGLVNAGVYLVERTVLEGIPAGREVSLEKEVFPGLIGALAGLVVDADLVDIGTPESLAAAQRLFAEAS
jgi:NDP-sugar pyrophosphorylase family protein